MSLPNALTPWRTFSTLAAALEQPVVAPVFLLTVTCGRLEPVWLNYSGATYYVIQDDEVSGVKVDGVALTLAASLAACSSTAGTYFQARSPFNTLYVHLADGGDPNSPAITVETFLTYRLADGSQDLGGYFWDPRVIDLPGLSTRINRDFGNGVAQIGGGTLTLANEDHFFDSLWRTVRGGPAGNPNTTFDVPGRVDQNWDAGDVSVAMGVAGLAYGSFVDLAKLAITGKAIDDQRFILNLKERKILLDKQYPFNVYTLTEFPQIRQSDIGRAKQTAFGQLLGRNPVCISVVDCEFKVADHPIKSFDGVKVFDQTTQTWTTVNFAAVDEPNGIFRLDPADWQDGVEVSVDFSGWVNDDATLTANPADVIQALIEETGESVNAAAMADAWAFFDVGYYVVNGARNTVRSPSVYLDSQKSLLSTIEDVLKQVRSYLLVNEAGEFYMKPFRNYQGSGLPLITDVDILEPGLRKETVQGVTKASKAIITYAQRPQENINSVYSYEATRQQYTRDQDEPLVITMDSIFVNQRDVRYLAASLVNELVKDPVAYAFRLKWRPFLWNVGDHVHVQSDRHGLDVIAEIQETRVNLTGRSVDLRLGNLRGFDEASGFWVSTSDTTPSGASLAWPSAGQVPGDESQYIRHEAGHWHNANDQATDTPKTSADYAVSRWQ